MSIIGADAAPRFDLGMINVTEGALALLSANEIAFAFHRHQAGDWGELDAPDREINERAVARGEGRLVSIYRARCGDRFYVITESDRAATTILSPSEY